MFSLSKDFLEFDGFCSTAGKAFDPYIHSPVSVHHSVNAQQNVRDLWDVIISAKEWRGFVKPPYNSFSSTP